MKSRDMVNKYFFSLVKECLVGGLITDLYDEDDIVVSSSMDLAWVYNTFYSKLYASLAPNERKGKFV